MARRALVDRVAEELSRLPLHATHAERAEVVVDLLSRPSQRRAVATVLVGIRPDQISALDALAISVDERGFALSNISGGVALAASETAKKVTLP